MDGSTVLFSRSSLLINPDKTKLFLLGTPQMLSQVPHDFCVTLLGKRLTPVPSAKDLEIKFDARLSYDDHETELVPKCTWSLCQLNRVKRIIDRPALLKANINALVLTRLHCCSTVWANATNGNIKNYRESKTSLREVSNCAKDILANRPDFIRRVLSFDRPDFPEFQPVTTLLSLIFRETLISRFSRF